MQRPKQRGRLFAVIGIILGLAMVTSFTLAWFLQGLSVPGNTVAAAKDERTYLELWAQSAVGTPDKDGNPTGLYGRVFRPVTKFTTDTAASPKVQPGYAARTKVIDESSGAECWQMPPDTLYQLVKKESAPGGDALVHDPANPDEYNRFLNDTGFLPTNTVLRRLVVRNTGGMPMSYDLSFGVLFGAGETGVEDTSYMLAEAIEVETYLVTDQAAAADNTPDADGNLPGRTKLGNLSGIGGEQLREASVSGRLGAATKTDGSFESEACAIYEFRFHFADSATVIYAEKAFQADVNLQAQGIVPVHYVESAEELKNLLAKANDPATPESDADYFTSGDTIRLTEDIVLDGNFRMTKLFHLDLGGKTLTVNGNFYAEVRPAATGDPDEFGVMDIGMGGGTLTVNGEAGLWAPGAAVRWAAGSTQPAKLNVRSLNGTPSLNELLDTSTWGG